MSPERGFLAQFDPAMVALPPHLIPIREAALALPRLLPTGAIRRHLAGLPALDLTDWIEQASEPQLRIAMLHYAFLVQAYVWGEPETPRALPANLAAPLWQLAGRTGQKPLLSYANYVLDNWGQIEPGPLFQTDNTYLLQPFLGGQDEAWFVLIHVAIEARAGEVLGCIPDLLTAARERDAVRLEAGLEAVSRGWDDIGEIFAHMPQRCDPYIYFHRVRPWIHGWRDNPALGPGLVYEGVAETRGQPQSFRGQTGSQSSIVPTMDALLGVDHARDPLRTYLDELHNYRPPAHRRFIDAVRCHSTVRAAVATVGSRGLRSLYNDCLIGLTKFRTRHLEYAATYISKQSCGTSGNAADVGTGGTPFMKYLKKHRCETEKHLLPV